MNKAPQKALSRVKRPSISDTPMAISIRKTQTPIGREMRQDHVAHESPMERESGMLGHLLGPILEAAKIRGEFPQCLLPPHAADDEAHDEATEMIDARLAFELDCGGYGNRKAESATIQ